MNTFRNLIIYLKKISLNITRLFLLHSKQASNANGNNHYLQYYFSLCQKKILFCLYYLLNKSLIKKLFSSYCLAVLFLRSFFLTENPSFLYIVSLIILVLNQIKPDLISFFNLVCIWVYLGTNLIVYDLIASHISSYTSNPNGVWLTTYLIISWKNSSHVIKRYIGGRAIGAIIIGKTPMTATGRATLIAGGLTGFAWLYNSHQDRKNAVTLAKELQEKQHAHERATQAKMQEAQHAHEKAMQAKKHADDLELLARTQYNSDHAAWKKKIFHRGPEPKYENYKPK